MRPSSCGSYVQSQSMEHTMSVWARWIPVTMPAATPWLMAWRTMMQFGRSPKMRCSASQVPSVLWSSTKMNVNAYAVSWASTLASVLAR